MSQNDGIRCLVGETAEHAKELADGWHTDHV
jgi:hypothetical protein